MGKKQESSLLPSLTNKAATPVVEMVRPRNSEAASRLTAGTNKASAEMTAKGKCLKFVLHA